DARLHAGRLEAWGRPGEGASFRLTLPRRAGIRLQGSPLPLEGPSKGVAAPPTGQLPVLNPPTGPTPTAIPELGVVDVDGVDIAHAPVPPARPDVDEEAR